MKAAVTESSSEKRYTIGTLSYTLRGLLVLVAWLLWGDFCFYLMETVSPNLLPLKAHRLEAPNWLIALFMSGIPNLLNATVCPAVSYWSDRFRSPLGRRIPFILYTIPFLSLFLALIGLSPVIAAWLRHAGILHNETLATLVMLGIFIAGFQFFNMFVSSVYYYLFNDVVPHEFLGRFLAVFRTVGVVASALFSFFIFPMAESHFTAIFVGAALIYAAALFSMCYKVKEGGYPPPPPLGETTAIWTGIKTFFKECFSNRFYWLFYLFVAFNAVTLTMVYFGSIFAQSLGVDLKQQGGVGGFLGIAFAVLLLPCGILSDKFHPMRTMLVANAGMTLVYPLSLVFLFVSIPPAHIFWIWTIITATMVPFWALYIASELPTYMQILPKDRFGQFAAATAMVRSVAALVGGMAGGGAA